ncbi:hypothetical protein [Roseomonas elaeocarpi]|uniref:Uncharacterized protein n=1 Tax=Roseomonas elaeocarpi TaxID=907779 RepID=A0ABV6JRF8_9PROT
MAHNISEETRRRRALAMRARDWSSDMLLGIGCSCGHRLKVRMGGVAQDYPHATFAEMIRRYRCRYCLRRPERVAILAPANYRRGGEVIIVLHGAVPEAQRLVCDMSRPSGGDLFRSRG